MSKKPKVCGIGKSYVIIRATEAGVFAGFLERKEGNEVTLSQARRIWRWEGAASLSQMAIDGVSKPKECKFPEAVPEQVILNVIEIIPCSLRAYSSIVSVPIWRA